MAQEELRLHHRHQRRAVMTGLATLLLGAASACQAVDKPVGLTLLFMNKGSDFMVVERFDPDGQRGPVPGGLGAEPNDVTNQGGKQMTFMPGDSKRGLPQFVEVEWSFEPESLRSFSKELFGRNDKYSPQWMKDYNEKYQTNLTVTNKRLDLTSILTSELVAQARTNPKTTNIKLTVTFKDDQVSIEATPEKWR